MLIYNVDNTIGVNNYFEVILFEFSLMWPLLILNFLYRSFECQYLKYTSEIYVRKEDIVNTNDQKKIMTKIGNQIP